MNPSKTSASAYSPLCSATHPYLGQPFGKLPEPLATRVGEALRPFRWDELEPIQREVLLYGHDIQHDPTLSSIGELDSKIVWEEDRLKEYEAMPTPMPSEVLARKRVVVDQVKLIETLERNRARAWDGRPANHWSRDFDDHGRRIKEPSNHALIEARLVIGPAAERDVLLRQAIDDYRKSKPKAGRGEAAAKFAVDQRFGLGETAIGNRIRKWYSDEEWPKKSVGGRPRKTVHRRK